MVHLEMHGTASSRTVVRKQGQIMAGKDKCGSGRNAMPVRVKLNDQGGDSLVDAEKMRVRLLLKSLSKQHILLLSSSNTSSSQSTM